ncbi:beta-N-acetylglucosaminidase domain-containing protein [Streptacidiphilus sp. EB129]|uniref:beta-N-acetylglucosaminidase domain-containing protein n=1 Tax=Streptacidiphilus sp. EB129 TaxID=3156262 RepID=UPI003514CA70
MEHRPSLPATVGSGLRRHLDQSAALQSVVHSPAVAGARRTAARTARRLAPETADRWIAAVKGTEPLLARARDGARRRGVALRATAALTVAAVVGGLVTGAQTATAAAPGRPGQVTTGQAGQAGQSAQAGQSGAAGQAALPQIFPRPQSEQAYGSAVPVPARVTVVATAKADPGALRAVRALLGAAGARQVVVTPVEPAPAPGSLTVYLGGLAEGAGGATDRALRGIAAAGGTESPLTPAGLPSGGYVLAVGQLPVGQPPAASQLTVGGHPVGGPPPAAATPSTATPSAATASAAKQPAGSGVVVLAGVDAAGTFNAAQSLRQLLQRTAAGAATLPGALVRDWPTTPVRGTEEAFYGTPWTTGQTLAQLDFLGRTKQNYFLYAPGDDPFRSSRWRDAYPAGQAAQLAALTREAALNHVTFGYGLAVGGSVCFTGSADQDALIAKLESLWGLGVRSFQLQFQDSSFTHWHCTADRIHYGTGPAATARAQSDLVALVLKRFVAAHPGSGPLSVLPTEYYQSGATPYRTALAKALDPSVRVAWTGVGVQPSTITDDQVSAAQKAFGHPLVVQDNALANDSTPDRLYLGPYQGRDTTVATGSAALLVNSLQQPVAARIPLFTAADFAWNPDGYDEASSWQAAAADLAAGQPAAAAALAALAGNSASAPQGQPGQPGETGRRSTEGEPESAYLRPLIAAFWAAQGQGGAAAASAAAALRAAFGTMAQAPATLAAAGLAPEDGGALGAEDAAWLAQLSGYGQAGQQAVDMLTAQRSGAADAGATAWAHQVRLRRLVQQLGQATVTVGAGVLDPFLKQALAAADSWAGLGGTPVTPTTTMGTAQDHDPALMVDGDPSTFYWSDEPPRVGDSVGVDLGSAEPVGGIRVTMGSGAGSTTADTSSTDVSSTDGSTTDGSTADGSGSAAVAADDYLHDAVLEYSTGVGGWTRIATYHGKKTVVATLPSGVVARYVRLRATRTQPGAVAVREFTVTAPRSAPSTVTGGPVGEPDSPASNVVDGDLGSPYRAVAPPQAGDALTVALGQPGPLDRVVVFTDPAVASQGSVEVHQAGRGWVRIGALRPGYTELPVDPKASADQVRLDWAAGGPPPVVYQVVPWYADSPVADLQLPQQSVDLEAGGDPEVLTGELQALGVTGASGTLRAQAPATAKGLTVSAPATVALPRGGLLAAPLRFAAAPGTAPGSYTVPVSFTANGHVVSQSVQVRVYPRTGGPDLALSATASSSADLSPAYSAAKVNDGDPTTRWSSPWTDDAWVQLKLAQPVSVGRAVLHWHSAYAAQYRIETSVDGVTWSTAATVLDGQGGDETVHFNAPEVRFVRIHGLQRATHFGYSLYGIELYAIVGGGAGTAGTPAAGTGTAAPTAPATPAPGTPATPPAVPSPGTTPAPGASSTPAAPGPTPTAGALG